MIKISEAEPVSRPREPSEGTVAARALGRGALWLTLCKFYFLASSYVIFFAIGEISRRKGVALLGDYRAVGAWLSILNTIVVGATVQTVSRFVGQAEDRARAIKIQAMVTQIGFGAVIAVAFWFLGPMAARATSQEQLAPALRIAAGIPLVTAMGAVLVGTLNGARRFGTQAFLDGLNTTLKVVGVVSALLLVPTAASAYGGFFAATMVVALAAFFLTSRVQAGLPKTDPATPSRRTILSYQMRTVGFMALVQWIVQMDIWYVSSWLTGTEGARSAGRELWAAVQLFASIPYSVVTAIVLVMFPVIAAGAADRTSAALATKSALRYSLILLTGIVAVMVASPASTLRFLPQKDFEALLLAHPSALLALRLQSVGFLAFCLLYLLGSAANARGKPTRSLVILISVALAQLGLGAWLLPRVGLAGQAAATAASIVVGLIWITAQTTRDLGPIVPGGTVLRSLAAGTIVAAVMSALGPFGRLSWVAACTAGFVLHFVLLTLFREFDALDRRRLLALVRGRRGAP